jgi:plasmid stabilization system protein ParE
MRFTVVWRRSAESALIDLWLDSADREAVRRAADEIDRLLGVDPLSAGESRIGNTRFLFVPPLGIYFDVVPDDRLVSVWSVWRRVA